MVKTRAVALETTIKAQAYSVLRQHLPLPLEVPRQQLLDSELAAPVEDCLDQELQNLVVLGPLRLNLVVEVFSETRTSQVDLGLKITPILLEALATIRAVVCSAAITIIISKSLVSALVRTPPILPPVSVHQGPRALGRTTTPQLEAASSGITTRVHLLGVGNSSNQHPTRSGALVATSKTRINPRIPQLQLSEALVQIPSHRRPVDCLVQPTTPRAILVAYLVITRTTNNPLLAVGSSAMQTTIRLGEVLFSDQSLLRPVQASLVMRRILAIQVGACLATTQIRTNRIRLVAYSTQITSSSRSQEAYLAAARAVACSITLTTTKIRNKLVHRPSSAEA